MSYFIIWMGCFVTFFIVAWMFARRVKSLQKRSNSALIVKINLYRVFSIALCFIAIGFLIGSFVTFILVHHFLMTPTYKIKIPEMKGQPVYFMEEIPTKKLINIM